MEKEILYIALELDKDSKDTLLDLATDLVNGVNFTPTFYCHHSTLCFWTDLTEELLEFAQEHIGEEFDIWAYMIGYNDKAVAVGVDYVCPCANKIKHITLMTNAKTNGKPKDSNYITKWNRINPIKLKGVLTIYYKS